MEEGPEAHMETDVSSTTEDVPETQEVTDSAGNVEMVIVVETLSEEEAYSSTQSDKELSPNNNSVNTVSTPSKGSTSTDTNTSKTPPKALNVSIEVSKASSSPGTPQKVTSKPNFNEAQTSTQAPHLQVLSTEVADSSVNDSTSVSPDKLVRSPVKDLQKPTSSKEFQKTPPKVANISPTKIVIRTPIKTPPKESLLKSPLKELPKTPIKIVPKTPTKALELTPTKELIITSTEDVEKTVDAQKTPQKAASSPQNVSKEVVTPVKVQRSLLKSSQKSSPKETVPCKSDESPKAKTEAETSTKDDQPSKTEVIVNGNIENQSDSDKTLASNTVVEKDVNTSQTEQLESEKEQNKSISRELKSLIKSAKESKIINECTQLKSKTRKSRTGLDTSANLNSSVEGEKIQNRRNSNNSQKSNCSEKSDKTGKRSMRSQNPEFVSKVKLFLNNVAKGHRDSDEDDDVDLNSSDRPAQIESTRTATPNKAKKPELSEKIVAVRTGKLRSDPYCWRCHWPIDGVNEKSHTPLVCTVCPRAYHYKCLSGSERNKIVVEKNYVCPECMLELHAESSETRSQALKKISLGMLCDLLKHALDRLMDLNGVEPFLQPVDRAVFPEYDKYVVHPMDLSQMSSNITAGQYGSTEAFLADAQWILHNSIIFNTLQSKLTAAARALVRSCRAEMGEIEACPQCYGAAHSRRSTWFTDVCSTPHILLWAKLKGFPYWPAKGMSVNNGQVDVRFFGAHDRAWVPAKDCFLYSEKDPNNFRTKRQDILDSMQEAEQHIRNISRKYGKFVYPPFKTQFEPSKLLEQLKMMIPDFVGEIKSPVTKEKSNSSPTVVKKKRRSNSKSSKSSTNEGEASETDESPATKTRKMADGAVIAQEEETNKEKPNGMEVDIPQTPAVKPKETRKRRRSELEEAVITIMEPTAPTEKRRRLENKEDKTTQESKEVAEQKSKSDEVATEKEKNKDNVPASTNTDKEKNLRVTPIRIALVNKRATRKSMSKDSPAKIDPNEKVTPKPKDKPEKEKTPKEALKKRRNSRHKSTSTPKDTAKATEKGESVGKDNKTNKDKSKDTQLNKDKSKETPTNKELDKSRTEKQRTASPKVRTSSPKSVKDRLHFDDDTTLAVIARQVAKNVISGLPTISNVMSLSTSANATNTTNSKTTANSNNDGKNEEQLVGRVGVRAFARMTSPEKEKNDGVQVEIKAEPIDLDDERQSEKIDMMNQFRLRPVNPPVNALNTNPLREVRINKVTVQPPQPRKPTPKPVENRARAKKTFPQTKKDDGRSELNGKNSMVYIPIQPPASGAPVRGPRPNVPVTNSSVQGIRMPAPISAPANPIPPVNSVSQPVVQVSSLTSTVTTSPSTATIGQVHTVPLMTSVNGQWMFSFQPVMSVGAIDGTSATPPVLNGTMDRPPAIVTVPSTGRPADNSTTPGEPPRLQQRPPLLIMNPLDASTPLSSVPPPAAAGPLTAKLNQNAVKLADFFRSLLEDSIEKVDDPAAVVSSLKMQIEQLRWKHQQELEEMKHNTELRLSEVRASFEKEKMRLVNETRRNAQAELDAAVTLAKSKQWCANCSGEAQLYCCWNTSYCDYSCQRDHWASHHAVCAQQRQDGSDPSSSPESRLQPQPDRLPKNGSMPTITVGGKVVGSRPNADKTNETPSLLKPHKTSLIVSMVEDQSGNKTMKCLGTYKPPQTITSQMSPVILNKQIMNEENANKKVVASSGGYLIVGSTGQNNSPVVMTSARRTHTMHIT